jgi:hypothetical protein
VNNIRLHFENPLYLLLLIPAIALALLPYFRLNKQNRGTRNRITSMAIHILTLILVALVLSGFVIFHNKVSIKNEVFLVVDYSFSSEGNKNLMDEKITKIAQELDDDYKLGMIVFGNEPILISKLSFDKNEVLSRYHQFDGTIASDGTNIEKPCSWPVRTSVPKMPDASF